MSTFGLLKKTKKYNLMKKAASFLFYTLILTFSCMMTSCGEDPDTGFDPGEESNTGFSINEDSYETQNAYLVFHSVTQYESDLMMDVTKIKNQFSFLFLDGTAISYDGDILYSIETSQSSFHNFRDFDSGGDIKENIAEVNIEEMVYEQSAASTTRININELSSDYTENGSSYGNPNLAGINYVVLDDDIAKFTVNSIDIDYETKTGTIDCQYSISPSWEGPIIGKYIGEFDILIE